MWGQLNKALNVVKCYFLELKNVGSCLVSIKSVLTMLN